MPDSPSNEANDNVATDEFADDADNAVDIDRSEPDESEGSGHTDRDAGPSGQVPREHPDEERIKQAVADGKPSVVFDEWRQHTPRYLEPEVFGQLLQSIRTAAANGVPALAEDAILQMLTIATGFMYRLDVQVERHLAEWDENMNPNWGPHDPNFVNDTLAILNKTNGYILEILRVYASLKREGVVGCGNDPVAAELTEKTARSQAARKKQKSAKSVGTAGKAE
jgi:hypothetical protein